MYDTLSAIDDISFTVKHEDMAECIRKTNCKSAEDVILFSREITALSKRSSPHNCHVYLLRLTVCCLRRLSCSNVESLVYVKLTRFAVRTDSAVVVYAVSSVGILLYLGYEDTLAYRVKSSCFDKENVTFFYRHSVYVFKQSIILYRLAEVLF